MEPIKKPWYASKTMIANILAGIATASIAFGFDIGLDPETQTLLVGGIMAIVNIILRLTTSTAIGKAE